MIPILLSLILMALVAIVLLLVRLIGRVDEVDRHAQLTWEEVRNLRLKSRARVSEYGVQSGEVTQEQQLRRLGRSSFGRRIVVGGDDDSEQKQNLRISGEDDNDTRD